MPVRVVGRKQRAGIAVADQFAVAADIGRRDQPALRHRLQRLQRRDQIGQPHALARIGEHIDQAVIALDLIVRHAADEADVRRRPATPPPARAIVASAGPPPTSSKPGVGARPDEVGHRRDQVVEAFVIVEAADEADHFGAGQPQFLGQRGVIAAPGCRTGAGRRRWARPVIFDAGMPRPIRSPRNPSQITATASARLQRPGLERAGGAIFRRTLGARSDCRPRHPPRRRGFRRAPAA